MSYLNRLPLTLPLLLLFGCSAPADEAEPLPKIETANHDSEDAGDSDGDDASQNQRNELDVSESDPSETEPDVTAPMDDFRWVDLSADGPDAREHTVLWIDPAAPDSLYLYGGYLYEPRQMTPAFDMWRFDLNDHRWVEVTQMGDEPPATAGEIALTSTPRTALHVGGTTANRVMPSSFGLVRVEGDEAHWETFEYEEQLGLQLGALAWDEERDQHIYASGLVDVGQGMGLLPTELAVSLRRASTTPNLSFLEVPEGELPTARYGPAWAMDSTGDRLVVFSGAQAPTADDPVNPASDVWALALAADSPAWQQLDTTGEGAPARRNGCHAFDPLNRRLFVFGGTADARTSVEGLYVLHLGEDTPRWEELDIPDGPDSRASCTAVYDPAREQILWGFGNNSYARYSDLWALEI